MAKTFLKRRCYRKRYTKLYWKPHRYVRFTCYSSRDGKTRYSIGEVDSVTGPLIGRPKSATFRTLDVVGLDTFVHVANNVYENVQEEERDVFKVPAFMHDMLEKKWLEVKRVKASS